MFLPNLWFSVKHELDRILVDSVPRRGKDSDSHIWDAFHTVDHKANDCKALHREADTPPNARNSTNKSRHTTYKDRNISCDIHSVDAHKQCYTSLHTNHNLSHLISKIETKKDVNNSHLHDKVVCTNDRIEAVCRKEIDKVHDPVDLHCWETG